MTSMPDHMTSTCDQEMTGEEQVRVVVHSPVHVRYMMKFSIQIFNVLGKGFLFFISNINYLRVNNIALSNTIGQLI